MTVKLRNILIPAPFVECVLREWVAYENRHVGCYAHDHAFGVLAVEQVHSRPNNRP